MKLHTTTIEENARGWGARRVRMDRWLYFLVAGGLIVFIAMCAWEWDNRWLVDSWEHHRAVKAVAERPWEPGNPTVPSDKPSIRYTPVTVALGMICRWGGVNPANGYSGSAIVCAVLFFVGLWKWLKVMGVRGGAWCVVVMMVCVWGAGIGDGSSWIGLLWGGGAPGWANSMALADLPGNMAYPSAWAFTATVWGWWVWERRNTGIREIHRGGRRERGEHQKRKAKETRSGAFGDGRLVRWVMLGSLVLLMAFAILTHVMTAAVMALGLGASALLKESNAKTPKRRNAETRAANISDTVTAVGELQSSTASPHPNPHPKREGVRSMALLAVVMLAAVGLSVLWPWYSLWDAVTMQADAVWFDREFLRRTMLVVTVPAVIGAAVSWWWIRDQGIAKWCLLCGGGCWAMGILAWFTESPTLARVPIAGVFFWQVMMGIAVWQSVSSSHVENVGGAQPTAAELDSRLRGKDSASALHPRKRRWAVPSLLVVLCAGLAVWGVLPQLKAIVFRPYLMRGWIAPVLGRENQQMDLRDRFARLIGKDADWGGVGRTDVVLSDVDTSWPVPSVAGRIVSPAHLEYFVRDQRERLADVQRFFSEEASGPERVAIIEKYEVKWVIVHKQRVSEALWDQLVRESAIVARDEDMVVMRVEG